MKNRVVAQIRISGAGDMTGKGRTEVARWMCRQARLLKRDGRMYADKFRSTYYATSETKEK